MAAGRTPECDRIKMHQSMYKGRTPPWKNTFRKKCFERLRSSRHKLLEQFRGLSTQTELKNDAIEVLMAEEWKSLCCFKNSLPSLLKNDANSKDMDDCEVNDVISFMEEIQKELLEEEKKILAEHQAYLEASQVQSAVDWLEREEVICPLCQKYPLFQNQSVIFCKCGMRIDTEQDGLTLNHLKSQLQQGLDIHNNNCCSSPGFSLISLTEITNLAITCQVCDYLFIVV